SRSGGPAGRQRHELTRESRRGCVCNALDNSVHAVVLPNGSRLSCGRLARRRKGSGRQSVPRQGHNTPLPLERSPPVSFKRLLGSTIGMVAATPPAPHTNTNEENQEQYGGGEEPAGRQPQDRTGQSRRSCLGNALDHWVHSVVLPNGSRLSCGRRARRRK